MFETSPTTEKLDAALAKAQGEITPAIKDRENPHFHSKYADLESIWEAARPALCKHGINVTQWLLASDGGKLTILTRVACGGEWMRSTFSIPVSKQDAQGYGSATTYARRFTLMSAIGISPGEDEDDDGERSIDRRKHRQENREQDESWRPDDNPRTARPSTAALPPSKNPSPVAPRPTGAPTPKPATPQTGAPPAGPAPATSAVAPTPVALGSSAEWHPGLPELADVKGYMGGRWTTAYFNDYLMRNFMKERLSELNKAQYHTLINDMQADNVNRNNPPNWQDDPSGDPRG